MECRSGTIHFSRTQRAAWTTRPWLRSVNKLCSPLEDVLTFHHRFLEGKPGSGIFYCLKSSFTECKECVHLYFFSAHTLTAQTFPGLKFPHNRLFFTSSMNTHFSNINSSIHSSLVLSRIHQYMGPDTISYSGHVGKIGICAGRTRAAWEGLGGYQCVMAHVAIGVELLVL